MKDANSRLVGMAGTAFGEAGADVFHAAPSVERADDLGAGGGDAVITLRRAVVEYVPGLAAIDMAIDVDMGLELRLEARDPRPGGGGLNNGGLEAHGSHSHSLSRAQFTRSCVQVQT